MDKLFHILYRVETMDGKCWREWIPVIAESIDDAESFVWEQLKSKYDLSETWTEQLEVLEF